MGRGQRLLELTAGLVLAAIGLWGVLWVMLGVGIYAQRPDPSVPDCDPCCGHPDTWGEVAEGSAYTAGSAFLDGLLLVAAFALLGHAIRDRAPRRRWFLLGPAVYALAVLAAIAVAQLTQL